MIQKALTNEPHATEKAHAEVICDDAAAKHNCTNPNQLVSQQDHLTAEHKAVLSKTLQQHERLLEGLKHKQLGTFPNRKCHIDLKPDTKAHHIKQPCLVPLNQMKAVKTEIA